MESQSVEDVFLQDAGPTIAEHASQCSFLFRKSMAIPNLTTDPTLMDDQLARFMLWASNIDVFGEPNVSLDYRLRYSATIVDILHQLLNVICDALTSLKPIDQPPQTPTSKKRRLSRSGNAEVTKRVEDDSSDTDSDEDHAERNASLITYTIGNTLTRLFRLSNAIRKSSKDSRANKIREYQDDEETTNAITELRLYTDCYIRVRFPEAPDALRLALAEANALRLKRLCYQRSHRRRIGLRLQTPKAQTGGFPLPKMTENAPSVRFTSGIPPQPKANARMPNTTEIPPAPVTYATTARQTAVRALYADSAVEVPRAKSVLVNNKLLFPPLPETNECPYCGVITEFKGGIKTAMWNNHVIADLEPFVCVFTHCVDSDKKRSSPLTFETSQSWLIHMQNTHGYAWECRAPSHDPIVFEDEVGFQEHSCREHSVPEAHLGTLSGAARRPIVKKISECPFGDDFSAPETSASSNVFSSEALHLHVAAHMKEIALLTLQKLPGDNEGGGDDDISHDVTSDVRLEDEGLPRIRRSMYSVLEDEDLAYENDIDDDSSQIEEARISSSVRRLDLGDKSADRTTELLLAVLDNDLPLVQSLINKGADLRSKGTHGRTALHFAAMHEQLEMMTLLLNSNVGEIASLKDDYGETPLHYVAKADFIPGIGLLVESGVFINIPDNFGLSPYIWAVIARNHSAVLSLLTFGADVDSASASGKSALAWASSLRNSDMAQLLIDEGADPMPQTQRRKLVPLEEAAASGCSSVVHMLRRCGVDMNYRDGEGWAALHWAAEQGHESIVSDLLDYGADLNAFSSYGTSPLHCAANGGHHNIVKLFLGAGADPLHSTCHGWTPLHHAAFMGHFRVVGTLMEHMETASILSADNHGWTALHLAILGRHSKTVEALSNSPAFPTCLLQTDENGLTAAEWLDLRSDSHNNMKKLALTKSRCCRAVTELRQAAYEGNVSLTEFFLAQGCDVDGADSGRRTALYSAAKKGHIQTLKTLLEKGADPNILPDGCNRWEEFIHDKAVLELLREAGYRPAWPIQEEAEITAILTTARETSTVSSPQLQVGSQHSQMSSTQEHQPVGSTGKKRSGPGNFWRRLRKYNLSL